LDGHKVNTVERKLTTLVYDYGRWTWHVSSAQTRRLLRGSVAESFVRISDVPVLLVRDAPRVEPEVDANL
jgi:hypothetical protein